MQLVVQVLGKVRVVYGTEVLTGKLSVKAQALLCYLAVTGEVHSRHALAGLLWGDVPEAKAKNSLRVTLALLRKLLPDYLVVTHQTIAFKGAGDVWLDWAVLQERVSGAGGGVDLITLYRGEFLTDFFIDGAPAFEDWLAQQRVYWQQQAQLAFSQTSDQLLATRAYAKAIGLLHHWLSFAPWQEAAHRQLMVAYGRTRDFANALRQYDVCQLNLEAELGVVPAPETVALFERIQGAREAQFEPLPSDETLFVGREGEIEQVVGLLLQADCRLVTIMGLGGMGKTRLALATAQRLREERTLAFLNGVVFVGLQSVESASALPLVLAGALDMTLPGRGNALTHLAKQLQQRELLLVLDNFEQILAATSQLQQLLADCPLLKLLVTSREPLQITAEWRLDLAGLDFPARGEVVTGLAQSGAEQLFVQTAQQGTPHFRLTEANRPLVQRLCQLVSGTPLALKLAAGWVRTLPLADIVAEVEGNLDLLATRLRDVPARQRSMQGVFDYTWGLLSPAGQRAFASLSVFRGGFTRPGAKQVANLSPHLLAELTDLGLVQITPADRYTIHELARQYGATKLPDQQAQAIQTAHCNYYANYAAQLAPQLLNAQQKVTYQAIYSDIGNLQQAWHTAVAQCDKANLANLLEPLFRFYRKQAWFVEGATRSSNAIHALEATQARDPDTLRLLSQLYVWQGALQGLVGQFESANVALEKGVYLAQTVEEARVIAFAWLIMGSILRDQSRAKEALRYVQEAMTIATELDDPVLIAPIKERLASLTWDLGQHGEAVVLMEETLTRFRELGDPTGVADALNGLGNVWMSMGRNEQALAYFQEALVIYEDLAAWLAVDTVLINLGMTSQNLGRTVAARTFYEQSLAICRRIGDEVGVAYCYTGLGLAAQAEGDGVTARQLIRQSWQMNKALGRDRYVGINLNFLGDFDKEVGDFEAARRKYEVCLAIFERIDHPWGVGVTQARLGELVLVQGNPAGAMAHFILASEIADHNDMHGTLMRALLRLADCLAQVGVVAMAMAVWAFVGVCPAGDTASQTTAQDHLARHSLNLPADIVEQAQRRGQQATLRELLDELALV